MPRDQRSCRATSKLARGFQKYRRFELSRKCLNSRSTVAVEKGMSTYIVCGGEARQSDTYEYY